MNILEIIFAIFSFIFNKLMKFIIGNLYIIYLTFNQKKAKEWRILSAESLNIPLSMPVLMTKAPRWNTHAIIGTLGPIKIKENLALDLTAINQCTDTWIGAIYSFPTYKTVVNLNSESGTIYDNWLNYNLSSGNYTIGLRYYNTDKDVIFPKIKIDGANIINPENIPANINDFYQKLIERKNWFYLALHYYIYTILKFRKYLPVSFIRYEFLPVGAPNTEFYYNYLAKNQSLEINIKEDILFNHNIYFTLYDRTSLPITWSHIKAEKYQLSPIKNNGYYLLRVRQKSQMRSVKFELQEQQLTQKLQIS